MKLSSVLQVIVAGKACSLQIGATMGNTYVFAFGLENPLHAGLARVVSCLHDLVIKQDSRTWQTFKRCGSWTGDGLLRDCNTACVWAMAIPHVFLA